MMRQLLDYDPETGELRWRERTIEWFHGHPHSPKGAMAAWNFDNAGKLASVSTNHGYATISLFSHPLRVHRVAWAIAYGEWPSGQIDHINGVRHDNRLANLRVVTNTENQRNRCRRSDNKSGVQGVRWEAKVNRWVVYIASRYMGRYVDFDRAVAARKQAERDHGYHPNHGRDPACSSLAVHVEHAQPEQASVT
jgi:hypothetical protein